MSHDRVHADVLALQATAEWAGCALGCVYSTTDEFEQAVIQARRITVSGERRWHLRQALCFVGILAALALIICMI
jgi:hypothetical protein